MIHADDQEARRAAIASMPKIELHHHLEGAAPPRFIQGLAGEQGIDVSGAFDEAGRYKYTDFLGFLDTYEMAVAPLKSPEHYARLTRAVLEEAAEANVIYVESFISPQFCGGGDVKAWAEYAQAIEEAAAGVPEVTLRGIVTVVRHFGPDQAKRAAACAQESLGKFWVGFGMGGDENAGTARDFSWAYDAAREAGLGLTAHAGEWNGPKSIRDVIEHLKVARIGHGVRAIEDPKLVEEIIARDIVLEVCPGSNLALGVYLDLAHHPVEMLRAAGVKVTISTDDPPFFDTDMAREFLALHETFGWEREHFQALNKTALAAAFCDVDTSARLKTRLERPHV